jgi:di/tricarboxylate transporter
MTAGGLGQGGGRAGGDGGQARLAAGVLIATALGWLLLSEIGRQYGWPGRFALLIDLAAIAGFVFALAVAWRLWRRRNP